MSTRDIVDGLSAITRRVQAATDDSRKTKPQEYYQAVVFLTTTHKHLFYTFDYTMPFYSAEIFMDQEQVRMFIPYFVKRLIDEGRLPSAVVLPDKSIDPQRLQTAVAPLVVTMMERIHDD